MRQVDLIMTKVGKWSNRSESIIPVFFLIPGEEVLEKLSSLDAKMPGLETLPKQMSDLASTLNTVSSDVELLHKEIKRLKEENCSLREKNRSLKEKISSLDSNFKDLEQYGRRKNLEIHGIHMSDDERIAEVESKVLTVLKKIDENISYQDIDVVHRLDKLIKTKPPASLSDLTLEKPETIFIKNGRN